MSTPLDTSSIPLSGVNLVEASAGTGKTHAITDLYERLVVEQGCAVENLLVVTYTVAATAELRHRVRSRLAASLAELRRDGAAALPSLWEANGVDHRLAMHRLTLATQSFDQAAIFTIHGFCQRALEDSAFEGAEPFRTELLAHAAPLIEEIVRDFWRANVSHRTMSSLRAFQAAGLSPRVLARWVERYLARHHLRVLVSGPGVRIDEAENEFREEFARTRQAWEEHSADFAAYLLNASFLNRNRYRLDTVTKRLELLGTTFASPDAPVTGLEELTSAFEFVSESRISDSVKAKATFVSHPFLEYGERLFQAASVLTLARQSETEQLLDALLIYVREQFQRRNRDARTRTFDDLLLGLERALRGPGGDVLSIALRAKYPFALVDEFQDTDPVQVEILKRIYPPSSFSSGRDGALFMVGDPKQSIYAFRGADIFAYLSGREAAQHVYSLATNYRSLTGLVETVNALFARREHPFVVPGITYQAVAAHHQAKTSDVGRAVAPFTVWRVRDDVKSDKRGIRRIFAERTAQEIARLLRDNEQVQVGSDFRVVQAHDIAILVRAHGQGEEIHAALSKHGIRSVRSGQGNVFSSREADFMQWLLDAVSAPRNVERVRAVLASPIFGVSGNQLAHWNEHDDAWDRELVRFYHWRTVWEREGFAAMLRAVLRDADTEARMLAAQGGERAVTNLFHLGELLQEAAIAMRPTPVELVAWFRQQRAGAATGSEEAEQRLESDESLVKIVTLHRSKGLQYPIVFYPFAWDDAPGRGPSPWEGIEYHEEGDLNAVLDLRVPKDDDASASSKREQLSERLRLLYVGLTRPQSRCYLGWYPKEGGKSSALGSLLSDNPSAKPADFLRGWQELADAVPGAVELSEIDVTPGGDDEWADAPPIELGGSRNANHAPLAPEPGAAALSNFSPSTSAQPTSSPSGAPLLVARQFHGNTRVRWSVSSFTSLTSDMSPDIPDHDVVVVTDDTAARSLLPRGARGGSCMHAMLERLNFNEPVAAQMGIVAGALTEFGFPLDSEAEMAELMQKTLSAQLLPNRPLSLDTLAGARIPELEFHFPVPDLSARALVRAAQASGYLSRFGAGNVRSGHLRGYLKGYIDLVFEHDGSFFVVDYKSHWLGNTPEGYQPQALHERIGQDGYELQYLLYSLAVHRLLRSRVPGYHYETHFGGVFYLFVRGIALGRSHREFDPTGIYFDRPTFDTIERLDAVLDGEGRHE